MRNNVLGMNANPPRGWIPIFAKTTDELDDYDYQAALEAAIRNAGHVYLYSAAGIMGTVTMTRPIALPSNIKLEIGANVTLDTSNLTAPCFTADGETNIRITGDGTLLCTSSSVPELTNTIGLVVDVSVEDADGVALPVDTEGSTIGGVPKRYGSRVVFMGDSITGNGYTAPSGTTLNKENPWGYSMWVKAFALGAIDTVANTGVAGAMSEAVLDQIPAALAATPDIVFEMSGINNLTNDATPASVVNSRRALWKTLHANGIRVFALPILPLNAAHASYTAARYQAILQCNDLLREACAADGTATFVPVFGVFVDPASATGDARTGYLFDNLHPGTLGAFALGQAIAQHAVVTAALKPYALKTSLMQDWSSGTAYRTFIANGLMAGTAGTEGTGVTGDTPTSWDCSRLAGTPTATISLVARSDGYGQDATVVITAGANNDEIQFRTADMPTHVAINDLGYAEIEITYSAATSLRSIYAFMILTIGGVNQFLYMGSTGTAANFTGLPSEGGPFVLRTPTTLFNKLTLDGASISACRLILGVSFSAAGGATVKFGRARGVKV